MCSSERHDAETDRGQSELVGFVLIFGVVVLTIALIGLTGFTGLDSAQDFQRTTNAEQAFTALADNVEDVARGRAPSRRTEVRIADASLSLEPSETNITVEYSNGTSSNATVRTAPIVYDSGSGTTITYRSGAIIREDEGNAVLLREPNVVLTNESVILPSISTSQPSGGKVGGTTAVDIRTQTGGVDLLVTNESVDEISLNITTPRAEAWERYFDQFDDSLVTVQRNENSVEVTIDTRNVDRVYVTVHRVDVSF
jgi:hypothetical protein